MTLSCPPHLPELARPVWQATVKMLAANGTLDAGTLPGIERYALSYARWREAEGKLASEGEVIAAPTSGVRAINPWLSIARGAAREMVKAEIELGLSPARRGRVAPSQCPMLADGSPAPPAPWDVLTQSGGKA